MEIIKPISSIFLLSNFDPGRCQKNIVRYSNALQRVQRFFLGVPRQACTNRRQVKGHTWIALCIANEPFDSRFDFRPIQQFQFHTSGWHLLARLAVRRHPAPHRSSFSHRAQPPYRVVQPGWTRKRIWPFRQTFQYSAAFNVGKIWTNQNALATIYASAIYLVSKIVSFELKPVNGQSGQQQLLQLPPRQSH